MPHGEKCVVLGTTGAGGTTWGMIVKAEKYEEVTPVIQCWHTAALYELIAHHLGTDHPENARLHQHYIVMSVLSALQKLCLTRPLATRDWLNEDKNVRRGGRYGEIIIGLEHFRHVCNTKSITCSPSRTTVAFLLYSPSVESSLRQISRSHASMALFV